MENSRLKGWILGLDLGPNSLGWSALPGNQEGNNGIIGAGVRAFEEGMDLENNGKGKSRGAERREARGRRRMLERTARRLRRLAVLLQKAGLLPEGDIKDSFQRHLLLTELDKKLDNPYRLRARALDQKLEPFELGRAIYHLAQRRGFKSNRKSAPKDEKESGKVNKSIGELQTKINGSGARTLGEYLAGLDGRKEKVRRIYTSRQMYENEFEKIWTTQQAYYAQILT